MKKIILLFCFISPFLTFSQVQDFELDYSMPKKYKIKAISVTGNEGVDKSIVIAYSGLSVGSEIFIPGDEISKAVLNLWKQKLFSDVRIVIEKVEEESVELGIELKTRPRLSRYSITGLTKSETDKIREKITLSQGDIITDQLTKNVTEEIIKFFREKGFYNPKITIKEQNDSLFGKNSTKLQININKGKKVRIEDVLLSGNQQVKSSKIRRLLKKTKQYRAWTFFRSSKYVQDLFEEDKNRVIEYYNSLGFRDAKITRDSVYYSSKNRLTVKLDIYEGIKYYFRNITWTGNTKYDTKQLSAILGIRKGDIYNADLLDQKLNMSMTGVDVSSLYMDDGYLFFNVRPVEVKVKDDSIDLEIRIFEGPQATINNIILQGNLRTSDHVILRELRTRPGQKFSRSDVIRSQRELATLGYFDPEQMNVIPSPNVEDGTVDITYVLTEKPTDQFQLQGGWGAGQFVGSLGFVFNNLSTRKLFNLKEWQPIPSGDGQKLSIRFQSNALYYSSFNISFSEPWFGGKKPNQFTVSAYWSITTNGYKKTDANRKDITIKGITVDLGKRLKFPDDYFIMNNSVSYQHYDLNNYDYEFSYSNGTSNNFCFEHLLTRNSIDAPIYPRSGSLFSLSLAWTPPYSLFTNKDYSTLPDAEKYKWMEYHKWKFDASWFLNIVGKLVLNTKTSFGFLGMYNRQIGITPFQRFFVGGDGLTGYHLDGRELIALRGYENNSLTAESNTETGGTIYSKYTFELRYPISLNPSATVYVTTFAEAGNSWLNFKEFNPFKVYRSLGAGVRIYMPYFGMLGFDLGYGFDKVPGNESANKVQFHISIGQQF